MRSGHTTYLHVLRILILWKKLGSIHLLLLAKTLLAGTFDPLIVKLGDLYLKMK